MYTKGVTWGYSLRVHISLQLSYEDTYIMNKFWYWKCITTWTTTLPVGVLHEALMDVDVLAGIIPTFRIILERIKVIRYTIGKCISQQFSVYCGIWMCIINTVDHKSRSRMFIISDVSFPNLPSIPICSTTYDWKINQRSFELLLKSDKFISLGNNTNNVFVYNKW